jgi:DNA-binding response OmpR family regulator
MQQKILVVDDDESILEVIQIVLESEGYQIQISQNSECFQDFTNCLPDLILLDVLLSGEDGREICKQLKRNKATAHIPVVILSAHTDANKLVDGSGADDFLEKPFDVEVLLEIVEKHLVSIQN